MRAASEAPNSAVAPTLRAAWTSPTRRTVSSPASESAHSVSPVAAASRIHVPVFLIHGADDRETYPEHSRRIFDALGGPKRLLILEGAGHNQSLQQSTWAEIESWLYAVLSGGND